MSDDNFWQMAQKRFSTWEMTKTILNTRAVEQQKHTQETFEKNGFQVINFPCLEIVTVSDTDFVRKQIIETSHSDVFVFTSQNAVIHAFKIQPNWKIPQQSVVIAVGNKTTEILEQHFTGDIWIPEKHNSEGVIELLKGLKKVTKLALITGKSGRNEIQNYCKENKIKLTQINIYQRQIPTVDPDVIQEIQNSKDLLILATSTTTLAHLKTMVSEKLWNKFQHQTIISASVRITEYAKELGFQSIITTNTANPEEICLFLNAVRL